MAEASGAFRDRALESLRPGRAAAVYVRLFTAAEQDVDRNTTWARGEGTVTVTAKSTWLDPGPSENGPIWVGHPVRTYPEWGGGVYAAAQMTDRAYREAVARWVANGA